MKTTNKRSEWIFAILIAAIIGGPTWFVRGQPRMPVGETSPAMVVGGDASALWQWARNATTNDAATTNNTAAIYTALYASTSGVNKIQFARGAKNIVIKVDCSTADVPETITVYGWKRGYSGKAAEGFIVDRFTVAGGSNATTNADPCAFDASTIGWYDVDTISDALTALGNPIGTATNIDADGDNRTGLRSIDLKGAEAFYFTATGCAASMKTRVYWYPLAGGG